MSKMTHNQFADFNNLFSQSQKYVIGWFGSLAWGT